MFNESTYYIPIQLLSFGVDAPEQDLKQLDQLETRTSVEVSVSKPVLPFPDLLEQENPVAIQQRNLQVLLTKILKLRKYQASNIIKDVFGATEPFYNFRSEANRFKRKI